MIKYYSKLKQEIVLKKLEINIEQLNLLLSKFFQKMNSNIMGDIRNNVIEIGTAIKNSVFAVVVNNGMHFYYLI